MGQKKENVIVIGAGIVGISTAIWLQRSGHKVTLIDREGPASGTSYGNAGILASAAIIPVTTLPQMKKAPKMLLNSDSPLFMRWSYLPKLLPFLARYLPMSQDKHVRRIAKSLADMMHDAADQHLALAKGTPAEKFIVQDDYIFGYANEEAFKKDAYDWNIRKELGVQFETLDAAQLAEYDPALKGRFGYAVRCLNHGRITDPGEYVKALCAHMEAKGGKLVIGEANNILKQGNLAVEIETTNGSFKADQIIITSGAWSAPLMKQLGVDVPLESERGYHLEFVNASVMPKTCTMVSAKKFAMTPMNGRLRCAGIVEFGGLTEKRSRAPFDLLKRQTLELLPDLKYDRIDEWMGHRPSTPDSLPLIGALKDTPNVWTGFGHQHIGLTAGPKTGRWLTQMIKGETPNTDMEPFNPDRF